jgi:hypothetical protein
MSYDEKVTNFIEVLNKAGDDEWFLLPGRKFDKVYVGNSNGQKQGRYMIERKTGSIYAIKSWAQVNTRRWFGTLDTIEQFDWTPFHAKPASNSTVASLIKDRESGYLAGYKKRGRPRKVLV